MLIRNAGHSIVKVTQVTDARLKASLRKVSKPKYENYGLPYHCCHREDAQPLILSEPAQLIFAFLPASHICKAGYRIRISVAGSDYRERDRAPVSPAPIVTILNTPSNPSYISLPVIDLKNVRDHKKGED